MDLATIIGLVLGFSLLTGAVMLGGTIIMFIDVPSILIVIGGTIAALFVKFRMSEVFSVVGISGKAFFNKTEDVDRIIGQLVDMANIARKDGILALEKVKSEDPFMQGAINHCVDGADPDFLEDVLNRDLNYLIDRHNKGIGILETVGDVAPAFGMIGTLIGLVQMLANMSDPNSIGPAMAVALITTLYGAIFANLVAIPLSGKLGMYSKDERLVKQVIIAGMTGIQKGVNPRMLQEALKTALPPDQRELA